MRRIDGSIAEGWGAPRVATRCATQVALRVIAWICRTAGLLLAATLHAQAAEPAFRYSAPIAVQQPAAFVQLPLPPSAYGRSRQPGLHDLRVVDARGERVPFALLAPRVAEAQDVELLRDAALYPLPRRPAAGKPWPSPVEVVVQGERISVKRSGGAAAVAGSPGWLFDLGDSKERRTDDPPPQSLRLRWSGPAEFSAPFDLETSDDLRSWRAAGSGQVMALVSDTGPLTQTSVALPGGVGRFIRLVWADASSAPAITGAQVIAARQRRVALDAPSELPFSASPEPVGKIALDDASKRALHFDLGGVLPLVQADLQWTSGTRVAPVRVQGRRHVDEPWREITSAVFYRLERGTSVSQSPPLVLQTSARYLRVLPDERAALLDAGATRLVVHAALASLVFAAQGQAPFALLAGAADAPPGALPANTLVPAIDDERPRFGRATLGEWTEVATVARRAEAAERQAALRPWLLWAVLLAGVAGLGFMVWRLARGRAGG
jgi:Protein of unknown function (DUF3999)